MAKWGSADFAQLRQLQERMQKLETDMDTFCKIAAKELAARLLALVLPPTPIGNYPEGSGKNGGTLKRGWIAKTHEEAESGSGEPTKAQAEAYAKSLPVRKTGKTFTVEVVNPVHYASYVEFGHRQEPGRYVPAIGKQLKVSWVEGKYFLFKSETNLERIAPSMLQKRLDRYLREVFNGD